MSLELAIVVAAINGDRLSPQITTSSNYKHWVSVEDWKRCIECESNHGKIWLIAEQPYPEPPIHPNCRCAIELMQAITAGIYRNFDGHLPQAPGRIWYEADINYKTGKRNNQRVLWSNDGLIFVTYDHYETFYEII